MKKWKIKIPKNIWTIAGLLIVVSLVIAFFTTMTGNRSVDIRMHFASISEGKNPDNSSFDINEILSDEVLGAASKKLNDKVNVKKLRSHLSVADNFSETMLQTVKQEIKGGTDTYMMFPAEYTLTYKVVSEDVKNDGFFAVIGASLESLFMPSANKILTAITESYEEYYTDAYIQKGNALNIDWSESDKLDYFNKAENLSVVLAKIDRFLEEKYNSNPDFVSGEYDLGYGELQTDVVNVINVDLENLKAQIVQNGLTKDREKLLYQFKYTADMNLDRNKRETAAYKINKDALDLYDANVTKVVFIPSIDIDEDFYMNRTKIGIDYLVENANSSKLGADEAYYNYQEYNNLAEKFGKAEEATAENYEKADELYERIKNKIDEICDYAKKIMIEEDEKIRYREIVTTKAYSGFTIVGFAFKTVKAFAFIAVISFFISYIWEFLKKIFIAEKEDKKV